MVSLTLTQHNTTQQNQGLNKMAFSVSINSCWRCNFRCTFCYLSHDQLKDSTLLPISVLDAKLGEVSKHETITHVDLYGGELTLLPDQYMVDTIDTIRKYFSGSISVITNLSLIPGWLYQDGIDVSVSWDYTEREQHELVLTNMVQFNKPFNVLMLASRGMVAWDDDTMMAVLRIINTLPKLQSVEIKPYSSNQANSDDITFAEFEEFIKHWIASSPIASRQYEFVNEANINSVLVGDGYSWSDDHIYITPRGEFAVLEFDHNGDEYFMPIHDWIDYLKWVTDEYVIVNTHHICGVCEFKGRCLSEHLRPIRNFAVESCSGLVGLVEWYRNTK